MSSQYEVELTSPKDKWYSYLLQTNPWVATLLLLFSCISLYSVSTASGSEAYLHIFKGKGLFHPIIKHIIIVAGSLVVAFAMPLVRKKKSLQVYGFLFYTLFSLALFVMLLTGGVTLNNAERWIYLPGGISVQPSEFWKLELIFFMSLVSSKYVQNGSPQDIKAYIHYYGLPLLLIGALVYFIGRSNLSTAFIYFGVVSVLFYIYQMPWRWYYKTFITLVALVVIAVGMVFILPKDSLGGRLDTFRARIERKTIRSQEDPFSINDENRQEQYGRIALANSKLIGRGIGESRIKDILPMAFSDYIFAVMIEELGLIALIGVPALYVWWFVLAGIMARREQDRFCRYVLYGIGFFYPFQALINFIVVSGLFTTGQPLPFISAGGSSFASNALSLGIMLMISRWQKEQIIPSRKKVSAKTENTDQI